MNNSIKLVLWLVLGFMLVNMFANGLGPSSERVVPVDYSTFVNMAKNGRIEAARLEELPNSRYQGILFRVQEDPKTLYRTTAPPDNGLMGDLLNSGVVVQAQEFDPGFWGPLLINMMPMAFLIGFWYWFFIRKSGAGGGGMGAMSFGQNKAKRLDPAVNKTRLTDVAGIDEAKEEVGEIVEFLRHPAQYFDLGAKLPRGLLMIGAPGTGKTLLARAIAGEAKVPFFTISGSDFVEMFVGVGASRVRAMFEEAKKCSPSIIFIDEIDAVGRKRGAGLGGGHDEREQTLNQLLVEMDGFADSQAVVVIAATNRPDVLDPALLRPGRFDRQVAVPRPDLKGREKILKVHSKHVVLSEEVDLVKIARGTVGFTGADLANLINEGALLAGRVQAKEVTVAHLEKAKDKILMGAERKSMKMTEKELTNTAYHECGHVIVAHRVEHTDPLHKVSIIPRGNALGVTMQLPEEDTYGKSQEQLEDTIAILMGGRIAEEIFSKQKTTGASNDFDRATAIARDMVCRYGMSTLGTRVFAENQGDVFLGQDVARHQNMSETLATRVDDAIDGIIDSQYARARKIIEEDKNIVEKMTRALLERETLEREEIETIIEGKELPPLVIEEEVVEVTEEPNK
jgi:cell division protease FtsH